MNTTTPLVETVRELSPDFERLNDQNIQLIIANTASETKCLTLGMVHRQAVADSTSLREDFERTYNASTVDYVPSFSGSYYSEICKQQARHGVVLLSKGDRQAGITNKYTLSSLGEELALPWAGNLLDWTLRHGINLKDFWGEPRVLKKDETSGTLVLFALFAKLRSSNEPTSRESLVSVLQECFNTSSRADLVGREIKKLSSHPFIDTSNGNFAIKEQHQEATDEFFTLLDGMSKLDPQFLEDGKANMALILADPTYATMLVRRVEASTAKTPDTRRDYSRLAQPLLRHIEDAGGSITMNNLDSSLFPKLSEDELRRFRRIIREGRLPGISLVTVGQPRSKNDTSHILLIPTPGH